MTAANLDERTVDGFGDEWSRFDQSKATAEELERTFQSYFAVFPWSSLPPNARGLDVGCGSGRWARFVSAKVGHLDCVDASPAALDVAKRNLAGAPNASFTCAVVGELPFADSSMDFAYSLGVLHHVPDTELGVRDCVRVLKPGAPFLVYLYYSFDNRPSWYRTLWQTSNLARNVISRLPHRAKHIIADGLAAGLYWPLARTALIGEKLGMDVTLIPLSSYRNHSFYIMRNDALDRFGTRLEKRFSRAEIEALLIRCGLKDIRFHEGIPHWCAVGIKA